MFADGRWKTNGIVFLGSGQRQCTRPACFCETAANDERDNDNGGIEALGWTMMDKSMMMEAQTEMVHMQTHLIRHRDVRFEDDVSASRSVLLRACSRRLACIAPPASTCRHRWRRWWAIWRRGRADGQCRGSQVGALGVVGTHGPRAHEWTGRCVNCGDGVAEVARWLSAGAWLVVSCLQRQMFQ